MSLKSWIVTKFLEGKLPNWTYRLIGKEAAKKLDLKENQMDTKKWYASKAIWSAILMAIVGAIQPISTAFGHPVQVPTWILEVLAGMGIYGVRTGDKPIA